MNIDNLISLITYVGWAIFLTAVLVSLVRRWRRAGPQAALAGLATLRLLPPLLVLLALYLFDVSIGFIPPHKMGVVISSLSPKGYRDRRLESGVRFVVPFLERVELYPFDAQTYTLSRNPLEGESVGDDSITARTSDGQEVALDISIIYHLDPDQIVQLHVTWQRRYERDLLRPLLQGLVRREASGFTVDEVNSIKRQALEAEITKDLSEVMEDQGLILDQFILRNIEFSPEYAASVEQKQVALQEAFQRQHEADQIRVLAEGEADRLRTLAAAEGEAAVLRAQGEAQAFELIAAALEKNPDLLTYQYVAKISPNIRVMLLPNNAPLLLPLDGALTETPADVAPSEPTPEPAPTP